MTAIVGLLILGLAGSVAFRLGWGGPLDIERLPWPGESLEPLPGVAAPFEVKPFRDDTRGLVYSPWATVPWAHLMWMITAVAVTMRAQRGGNRVIDPVALVAACLCAAALLAVGGAAANVAATGNWSSPPFLRWRTSPAELVPGLWMLGAAALVSLIALVRAFWRPSVLGLTLAGTSLVAASWAGALVDVALLTQRRGSDLADPGTMVLAAIVNSRPVIWERPVFVTLECDGLKQCRVLTQDYRDSSIARPREWRGAIDDAQLLMEIDTAVATSGSTGPWGEPEVFLTIAANAPFDELRPALQRFHEGGVDVFWVTGAPRVERGYQPHLLWTLRGDPDESRGPVRAALTADGSASGGARLVVDGVSHKNVAAVFDAKVFPEDALLEGTVGDDVRWGDLVHALDALLGQVTFRP